MNQELKDKLAKVYALVEGGATEGERAAARKALDRIIARYGIDEKKVQELGTQLREFAYTSKLEMWLCNRLLLHLLGINQGDVFLRTQKFVGFGVIRCKRVVCKLSYIDFVLMETAYEYFRRHMKAQWKKVCEPLIKKTKKASRAKKRLKLEPAFFSEYIIKSRLYKPEEVTKLDYEQMTRAEIETALKMHDVEGGTYHKQVNSNLQLEY